MDKFLKNYIAIAILVIIFVIFMVMYKFNPALMKNIPIISNSSDLYKQACANYITTFLDVNYNKKVVFHKKGIDSADTSKLQITPKSRFNLANKNNKINVVVVSGLKANIENDLSYKITCWVNSSFQEDPKYITSYDILKVDISKQGNESGFKVSQENY